MGNAFSGYLWVQAEQLDADGLAFGAFTTDEFMVGTSGALVIVLGTNDVTAGLTGGLRVEYYDSGVWTQTGIVGPAVPEAQITTAGKKHRITAVLYGGTPNAPAPEDYWRGDVWFLVMPMIDPIAAHWFDE